MDKERDPVLAALALMIDQVLTEEGGERGFLLLVVTPPKDGKFSAELISTLPPQAQRDVLVHALEVVEWRLQVEQEGARYDA